MEWPTQSISPIPSLRIQNAIIPSFMHGEVWKRESRGKPDPKNIMRNISQQYYLQIHRPFALEEN